MQIGEGEGARFLPESNAACWYLASGSHLVPGDPFGQANALRWMFFEQYQHEPNVATLRFWLRFVGEDNLTSEQRAMIPAKRAGGQAALELMDAELANRAFLCGDAVSLGDIALFAYSHLAPEAGFDLGNLAPSDRLDQANRAASRLCANGLGICRRPAKLRRFGTSRRRTATCPSHLPEFSPNRHGPVNRP